MDNNIQWWQEVRENENFSFPRTEQKDFSKSIINIQCMANRTGVLFPVFIHHKSINDFLKEFDQNLNSFASKIRKNERENINPLLFNINNMKQMLTKISYELKYLYIAIHNYKKKQYKDVIDKRTIQDFFSKEIILAECKKLKNNDLKEYLNALYLKKITEADLYPSQLQDINAFLRNNIQTKQCVFNNQTFTLSDDDCNFLKGLIQDNAYLANDLVANRDNYLENIISNYQQVEQNEFHIPVIIDQLPVVIKKITDRIAPTVSLVEGEYEDCTIKNTEVSQEPLSIQIKKCINSIDNSFESSPSDYDLTYNDVINKYSILAYDP